MRPLTPLRNAPDSRNSRASLPSTPLKKKPKEIWNLVVSVVPCLALALGLFGGPSAAQGAEVSGNGGGAVNLVGFQHFATFAFSARSGAAQGDAGNFRLTIDDPGQPLDVHVDIDCVNVFANPTVGPGGVAFGGAGGRIGGKVNRVSPMPNAYNLSPGDEMFFSINDFADVSNSMQDELATLIVKPPMGPICNIFGPGRYIPISTGNITIKLP